MNVALCCATIAAMNDASPTTEGAPWLESTNGVATLILRRPSQRNSLNDEDLHTLLQIFEHINRQPDIDVVVLRGRHQPHSAPVFSAGYNVGGFDEDPLAPLRFEKIVQAFEQLRPITVCALDGSVYGGATDLVLASDLIVAQKGLHWRMPALALGLHYYPSGLQRYVSRMGVNLSKRAFLLGQAMDYESLEACGLFSALVDASAFEATLARTVEQLLRMAPRGSQQTKQSINDIAADRFSHPTINERAKASALGEEFAHGRDAFARKQAPQFRQTPTRLS
jgi:enoyl-CoA hydratase/carnithine racemase